MLVHGYDEEEDHDDDYFLLAKIFTIYFQYSWWPANSGGCDGSVCIICSTLLRVSSDFSI